MKIIRIKIKPEITYSKLIQDRYIKYIYDWNDKLTVDACAMADLWTIIPKTYCLN